MKPFTVQLDAPVNNLLTRDSGRFLAIIFEKFTVMYNLKTFVAQMGKITNWSRILLYVWM